MMRVTNRSQSYDAVRATWRQGPDIYQPVGSADNPDCGCDPFTLPARGDRCNEAKSTCTSPRLSVSKKKVSRPEWGSSGSLASVHAGADGGPSKAKEVGGFYIGDYSWIPYYGPEWELDPDDGGDTGTDPGERTTLGTPWTIPVTIRGHPRWKGKTETARFHLGRKVTTRTTKKTKGHCLETLASRSMVTIIFGRSLRWHISAFRIASG